MNIEDMRIGGRYMLAGELVECVGLTREMAGGRAPTARRNGEVLVFPEGDPEDNTFSRNFSFIAEELLQAYKTGYEAAWTDRGTLASEKQGGA